MVITIKNPRHSSTRNAIISSCYIGDTYFCQCLENLSSCISAGEYEITKYNSPKFKRYVPLLVNVPSRNFIEIHPANKSAELRGCLAFGSLSSNGFGLESSRYYTDELTRQIFTELDNNKKVTIKIIRYETN